MQQTQRPIRVGLGTPQAGPNATAEFIRDFVTQARSCGIGAFWVGEHIVMGNFRHRAKVTETFLDPLALLAFIAGMDGQVELGTSVLVVPYRNPLVLLKGICTIAHLTGRRFTIGVGAGWAEEEFTTLGAEFRRRGRATDEFCEIFHKMREGSEEPWQVGRYRYAGRGFEPSPRPDTELWVGGNGAVAHARTVRYGSGWQPTGLSPEDVRSGMEQVRRLAEEAGRDPTGIACGLRLRVRVLPETYRSELPGLFESYLAAGVTDFLCEINTRERAYTLEAIANLVESFRLAGVDVRA